jgi:hypothetical protein
MIGNTWVYIRSKTAGGDYGMGTFGSATKHRALVAEKANLIKTAAGEEYTSMKNALVFGADISDGDQISFDNYEWFDIVAREKSARFTGPRIGTLVYV